MLINSHTARPKMLRVDEDFCKCLLSNFAQYQAQAAAHSYQIYQNIIKYQKQISYAADRVKYFLMTQIPYN